jgi:phosphoribosyl 1,2-cyclic phosphate phosphodiesterase
MKGSLTLLGTSGSAGVPMIGCKCAVCISPSPFNKRLRPSAYVQINGKSLLVDVGPDFRQQALKFGIDHLDGLLLTHTHYDHIAGVDELRLFCFRQKKPFPCLLSKESFKDLRERYAYLFRGKAEEGKTISTELDCHVLKEACGEVEFCHVPVSFCSYYQGETKVNGFRIGNIAYISDIKQYEESIFETLDGVETLVLSALKQESSPLHLSFEDAICFAERSGAKQTWLTHVGHFHDHDAANFLLPSFVRLGFDGLTLDFECTK